MNYFDYETSIAPDIAEIFKFANSPSLDRINATIISNIDPANTYASLCNQELDEVIIRASNSPITITNCSIKLLCILTTHRIHSTKQFAHIDGCTIDTVYSEFNIKMTNCKINYYYHIYPLSQLYDCTINSYFGDVNSIQDPGNILVSNVHICSKLSDTLLRNHRISIVKSRRLIDQELLFPQNLFYCHMRFAKHIPWQSVLVPANKSSKIDLSNFTCVKSIFGNNMSLTTMSTNDQECDSIHLINLFNLTVSGQIRANRLTVTSPYLDSHNDIFRLIKPIGPRIVKINLANTKESTIDLNNYDNLSDDSIISVSSKSIKLIEYNGLSMQEIIKAKIFVSKQYNFLNGNLPIDYYMDLQVFNNNTLKHLLNSTSSQYISVTIDETYLDSSLVLANGLIDRLIITKQLDRLDLSNMNIVSIECTSRISIVQLINLSKFETPLNVAFKYKINCLTVDTSAIVSGSKVVTPTSNLHIIGRISFDNSKYVIPSIDLTDIQCNDITLKDLYLPELKLPNDSGARVSLTRCTIGKMMSGNCVNNQCLLDMDNCSIIDADNSSPVNGRYKNMWGTKVKMIRFSSILFNKDKLDKVTIDSNEHITLVNTLIETLDLVQLQHHIKSISLTNCVVRHYNHSNAIKCNYVSTVFLNATKYDKAKFNGTVTSCAQSFSRFIKQTN